MRSPAQLARPRTTTATPGLRGNRSSRRAASRGERPHEPIASGQREHLGTTAIPAPKTIPRLRLAAIATLCVAGLGLAACGDDEETAADPTATTGATGAGGTAIGDIREQFDAAVRSSLEAEAAAGAPVDVDCAIDRLDQVLSDEEVRGLVDSFAEGTPPPTSISDSLTEVRAECAE